jgi:hypothetical protein
LVDSVNDQYAFWNAVKKISFKQGMIRNTVSIDTWYEHFKALLDKRIDDDDDMFSEDESNDMDDESVLNDEILNAPITKDEIVLALRKLKCKKAAGPDGVIGELLKYAGSVVVDFLLIFFECAV